MFTVTLRLNKKLGYHQEAATPRDASCLSVVSNL